MDAITGNLTSFLLSITALVTVIIELWGLSIIVIAILQEAYRVVFRHKLDFHKINLDNKLNASLGTALEVLLVAEVLKTITIDDYRNLVIIGVLIVLRIAITLLLFWDSTHRRKAEQFQNN